MSAKTFFLVMYDDEQGVCAPYGFDTECDGALCCSGTLALFGSRKEARSAINISRKWAQLKQAQGHPANWDFLGDGFKNVRIVPAVYSEQTAGKS